MLRTLIALLLAGMPALAETQQDGHVAPRLGAATNFGQSWFPEYLSGAERLGLEIYRDEMFWSGIERADGSFVFDNARTRFPYRIQALGRELIFIINDTHPLYDGDQTPVSDRGLAGLAEYARQVVQTYPAITTIEIGNEMNSETFAFGPGWSAEIATRAESYARLAKAVAGAVRAVRSDIRILGGAAHSIPLAWFQEIYRHRLEGVFDAVVIHPYTVPPEQLPRQIALLRQEVPQLRDMPLSVTEFGEDDAEAAPSYLLKFYCQMALSNVESAIWYPLNPRGDGLTALLAEDGSVTPTGEAYRTAATWFEGKRVAPYRPDAFTYGCLFGSNTLLLWGEPREVALADYLYPYDAEGRLLDRNGLVLSMERPLLLRSEARRIDPERALRLGPQTIIADSFHQFAYPEQGGDPFERVARQGDRIWPLVTMPGQERGGVPWTPYLGTEVDGVAKAGASWALPSLPPAGEIEIALRYTVTEAERADAKVWVAPSANSRDGVTVTLWLNNSAVMSEVVTEPRWVKAPGLSLRRGDVLEAALGPNQNGDGDDTEFRFVIRSAAQ